MTEAQINEIIEGQKTIINGINKLLSLHTNDPYKYETSSALNMAQAADLLNIPQSTLLEACLNRELPCRKVGAKYIFLRDTLVTWLNLDEPKVDFKECIDSEIAAELLGVPVAKMRQWAKGYAYYKTPVIREGARFFYEKDKLLEWAETPEIKKLKDEYFRNKVLNEQRRKEAEARYEAEKLEKEVKKQQRLRKKMLLYIPDENRKF